jgi:hypothetical protein
MAKNQKLYCYAKANQMVDHRFTDDVAICWAKNKEEAYNKFRLAYALATLDDIFEPNYSLCDKIAILTDY